MIDIDWSAAPAEIVMRLELAAPLLLLTPQVDLLRDRLDLVPSLPLEGRPWAALLAAELVSNARGARFAGPYIKLARDGFLASGDLRGMGFCAAVEGLNALTEGRLADVGKLLDESRNLLGPDSPWLEHLLAASSWARYDCGDLAGSIEIAEQALGQARVRGNTYGEGSAWFHLGYFLQWTGDFAAAGRALDAALDALGHDLSVYEVALTIAAQGFVAYLEGRDADAEALFESALSTEVTEARTDGWMDAVFRVLRAEATAATATTRALADARIAQGVLSKLGDTWWGNWALLATGLALGASGHARASDDAFDAVDRSEERRLERARAELRHGELLLDRGEFDRAAVLLRHAADVLAECGANYWAVRGWIGLLACQPRDARKIRALAHARAGDGPAWRRVWRGQAVLDVRLIGRAEVFRDGRALKFPTRHTAAGFFHLVLDGDGGTTASRLGTDLWPDQPTDAVNKNLNTMLWNLRRTLGSSGERLQRRGNIITLDIDAGEVDLFRELAARGLGWPGKDLSDLATLSPVPPAPAWSVLPPFSDAEWVVEHQLHTDALRATLP